MVEQRHVVKELVSEHAKLLNGRFPEPMTEEFWRKVASLPENDQEQVKKLCKLAETLKQSLCHNK